MEAILAHFCQYLWIFHGNTLWHTLILLIFHFWWIFSGNKFWQISFSERRQSEWFSGYQVGLDNADEEDKISKEEKAADIADKCFNHKSAHNWRKKTYSLLYSSFQTYYTTIFWCPADTLFNCFYCGQCFVTLSNTYRLIHQKLVPPFVFGIFLVRVKSAFGTQPLCSTDVSVMHISVINISIIHTSTALLFFGRKKTFWGKATWMSIC